MLFCSFFLIIFKIILEDSIYINWINTWKAREAGTPVPECLMFFNKSEGILIYFKDENKCKKSWWRRFQ